MGLLPMACWGGLAFSCLWSGILARFKGYSALCWLLAGGPIGVVVLFFLPLTGSLEPQKQIKGNRLGLAVSGAFLFAGWLLKKFL